ncbi:MAG: hypothetical protein RSD09_04655 [Bacilli bacterium]
MQTFNYLMLLTSKPITDLDWTTSIVIPIITALLSSGLLVGIIEFVKWKMDIKIANITHERKEWRKELREIASRLGDDNEPLTKILIDLKVRINTLGIKDRENIPDSTEDKERYFFKDSYIWYLIEKTEEEIDSNFPNDKFLKLYKTQLVLSISLLLKYDWDRSKEEIEAKSENKYELSLIVLTIICLLIITYPVFSDKADLIILITVFAILICVPLGVSLFIFTHSKGYTKTIDIFSEYPFSYIFLMFILNVVLIILFCLIYNCFPYITNYWLFKSFLGVFTIFLLSNSLFSLCYLILATKIKKDVIKIDNKYIEILDYIFNPKTLKSKSDSKE